MEVDAVHQFHRDVAERAILAVLVDGAHVAMPDLAGEADLRPEAGRELLRSRGLGMEDLDRDDLVEHAVVRAIHATEAARAQKLLDLVAIVQDGARREREEAAAAGLARLAGA